jgi:hypothetical protein
VTAAPFVGYLFVHPDKEQLNRIESKQERSNKDEQ